MDRANEYNVDGSLLGLGSDILLDIMSEMELPQDVRQFLALCQKIYKLKDHPRFEKIIQSIVQITPVFIIMEASQGCVEKNKFIHTGENECCTIAIEPAISEGIVRIDLIFENTSYSCILGVADASYYFAAGRHPIYDGNHLSKYVKRNQQYADGQRISIEVDMATVPRRATFFVDDVEQPNYIIGIPSEIRFWAYTIYSSSSFTVTKFKRLIKSSTKGVAGSKALEWGKKWK
ncbi:MAG: hypothetical protein EZS28_004135 [Streblomastix strix]|uniref:Uncharacterized protein n=1 Tax=Streblomastix strix TaxID=222440 RepID=A0A5J4WZQ9_9EUKA|nr:MAG: hypothetical protein EZS28_004135 [Streblomastix strix]